MFSFDFRKTSAWDYQRHLLRPWPTVTVTLHLDHDYVPCGPRLRWFWAIVPFDVDRDYAMWATITVKHKMRPTSQRNPGPHHNGISGPHPMESPAHIDRNTQVAGRQPPHPIKHAVRSWRCNHATATRAGQRSDRVGSARQTSSISFNLAPRQGTGTDRETSSTGLGTIAAKSPSCEPVTLH